MNDPRGEWSLSDTVKRYHRHLLAHVDRFAWPARIENDDGLLGRMARDARRRRDADVSPKLTAVDVSSSGSGIDLVVFPDAVRYEAVDAARWDRILREHVDGGRVAADVPHRTVETRWVLVCVHGKRDDRCGRCGPPLLSALRRACASEGLTDLRVVGSSHVGGHKYAGNMIIYPEGTWYGYVSPDDAPRIVREHLVEGRVVEDLHRGSMRKR